MFQILGLYFITTYILKIFCVIFHILKCDTLLLVTYISFSDGPDQVSEIGFFATRNQFEKWVRLQVEQGFSSFLPAKFLPFLMIFHTF